MPLPPAVSLICMVMVFLTSNGMVRSDKQVGRLATTNMVHYSCGLAHARIVCVCVCEITCELEDLLSYMLATHNDLNYQTCVIFALEYGGEPQATNQGAGEPVLAFYRRRRSNQDLVASLNHFLAFFLSNFFV